MVRRDSILKHSGSVKNTDRRVSIKQNQPIIVEYLSEKRQAQPSPQQQHIASTATAPPNGNVQKMSNARPASLILTKGERPTFKLIRSPSIDQDQDEGTLVNMAGRSEMPNLMVNSMSNVKDDDDDDESMPLVQNSGKESTTITSSGNNLANL